jgi:prepilin-type N-terminal cleavage/methylation domain-containing protein
MKMHNTTQGTGASGLHPGGMFDNSPTFQRWEAGFSGPRVPEGRLKRGGQSAVPTGFRASKAQVTNVLAFTLIEMLVVIAVISILAAMIFPVTGAINRTKVRTRARAELNQVQAAIDAYKIKLGYYPPVDTNYSAMNGLYYELVGTTFNAAANTYTTLDGSTRFLTTDFGINTFGPAVNGFLNCTRGAGGDEGQPAVNFFKGFKTGQFLAVTNPTATVLGTTLQGPLMYQSTTGGKINPWRYNSTTPTNNPNSYDLWVDVLVGHETNRISNWSTKWIRL